MAARSGSSPPNANSIRKGCRRLLASAGVFSLWGYMLDGWMGALALPVPGVVLLMLLFAWPKRAWRQPDYTIKQLGSDMLAHLGADPPARPGPAHDLSALRAVSRDAEVTPTTQTQAHNDRHKGSAIRSLMIAICGGVAMVDVLAAMLFNQPQLLAVLAVTTPALALAIAGLALSSKLRRAAPAMTGKISDRADEPQGLLPRRRI